MVNGSLVQFTLYYLQLRVLLSVTYGCMCKKKRHGKKKYYHTSRYPTFNPFISAELLNAKCEMKLPKKYIYRTTSRFETRLVYTYAHPKTQKIN